MHGEEMGKQVQIINLDKEQASKQLQKQRDFTNLFILPAHPLLNPSHHYNEDHRVHTTLFESAVSMSIAPIPRCQVPQTFPSQFIRQPALCHVTTAIQLPIPIALHELGGACEDGECALMRHEESE